MSKTEQDHIIEVEDDDVWVVLNQTTGKMTSIHWMKTGGVFAYFSVPGFLRYMIETRFDPRPSEMYFVGVSMADVWRVRVEFRLIKRSEV
jgi:hypothetical protein